jgi:hypothetical protein
MALTFKPKNRQVRIIYSDDPGGVDSVTKNSGKVFAVIGPFDDHTDKGDLQDMLETVLRGWNTEAAL